MYLRTEKWPNGDSFSYIPFYECNHCHKEICDMHPHTPIDDRHYCWQCSFIVGLIEGNEFLRWSGMSGMKLKVAVRDGEIHTWTTKKPPWETPDKEFRRTKAYRVWRINVLDRDKRTCQHCGGKEKLQAHHIKSFSKYEKLRYKTSNGLTLCEPCHRMVHSKRPKVASG